MAALLLLGLIVWLTLQAYTAKNYTDENFPLYSGEYAAESPESVNTITVVSYNIWFGENIDQAVVELKEIQSQKGLDILLLQEMDEAGTEQIARELHMNYIYYPAAVEPTYDKNFGNAILTVWPIVDSQKLVLPHKSLSNRMNRIATAATIRIQEANILVYSIHTESIFTLSQFREDQYTAVLDNIGPGAALVIIGGDFNTFTNEEIEKIENVYGQAGLARVSEDGGTTLVRYGIELSPDHIFARGFTVDEVGQLAERTASDHLPIWVRLRIK